LYPSITASGGIGNTTGRLFFRSFLYEGIMRAHTEKVVVGPPDHRARPENEDRPAGVNGMIANSRRRSIDSPGGMNRYFQLLFGAADSRSGCSSSSTFAHPV
jgi:hypothetical protein